MKITKTIITEILEKCLTHARIKEKLSALTYNEKYDLLKQGDKLTRLESEEYEKLNKAYSIERKKLEEKYDEEVEKHTRFLRKIGIKEEDLNEIIKEDINPKYDELFSELEEEFDSRIWDYEKRIFTDYTASKGDKPIPNFNWDDYVYDYNRQESFNVNDEGGWVDMTDVKLSASRESIGKYETEMINKQSNINYTDKELSWLKQYFDDGRLSSVLTYMIHGREPQSFQDVEPTEYEHYGDTMYVEYNITERWKDDFRNIKYHLDNAINKSDGLDKPTILYHAGRIDPSLLPGDKGIWKSYTSLSFQEQSMEKHRQIHRDYWNVIVLAPTGTKGVCANDERFHGYSFVDEHEYLTGRNTEYTVIDMDFDNRTQIIMLD